MCADPEADLPEVFDGLYLFRAEAQDAEGLKRHPTYFREPRGEVEVFEGFYRKMEGCLAKAVEQVEMAQPRVAPGCELTFEAESLPIRWFHHTIRTTANFYESCRLRDRLLAGEGDASDWERWREVLLDERDNARESVPVAAADVRLDFYYGGDHTFPHLGDMLAAKLDLLEAEIEGFLPSAAERLGSG
jgi:hypothetical protein